MSTDEAVPEQSTDLEATDGENVAGGTHKGPHTPNPLTKGAKGLGGSVPSPSDSSHDPDQGHDHSIDQPY